MMISKAGKILLGFSSNGFTDVMLFIAKVCPSTIKRVFVTLTPSFSKKIVSSTITLPL